MATKLLNSIMRANKNSILIVLVSQCHKAAFFCSWFLKKIRWRPSKVEGMFYYVRMMEHMVTLIHANRVRNESLPSAQIHGQINQHTTQYLFFNKQSRLFVAQVIIQKHHVALLT